MQNHHNLLYREEEREMLPLLKVGPSSSLARGYLVQMTQRSIRITSTSASDASRGVRWRKVYWLVHGTRPAHAGRRTRKRSGPRKEA